MVSSVNEIQDKKPKSTKETTPDGGVLISFDAELKQAEDEDVPIESHNLVPFIKKTKANKFRLRGDENQLVDGPGILDNIGETIINDYDTDDASLSEWKIGVAKAVKLFTGHIEGDTENKSRVMVPLMPIATTQFHARAYEALLPPREIAKAIPSGPEDVPRSERVSKYMNWDLQYNMDTFREEFDKTLIQLPLIGSAWKKTLRNTMKGKNESKYVSSEDVVISYQADPYDPDRISHKLMMSKNDIRVRVNEGIFDSSAWDLDSVGSGGESVDANPIKTQKDKSQGINDNRSESTDGLPRLVIEQQRMWDLDGDGIEEPCIITVDHSTKKVLRIISRETKDKNNKDVVINLWTYYEFIPNPEGSYGIGFWALIGHLNEASNTLINEIIDAGALANLQGGFVSKRSGIKKGALSFKRGEYQQVDATIDDIRKALFTFDFKGPNAALFQTLNILFEFSKLVTTVSETQTGALPRSDTPATAIISAAEEGRKVFGAVFRRIHNSFRKELNKIARLNSIYLDMDEYSRVLGDSALIGLSEEQILEIGPQDFLDTSEVIPVSDPSMISQSEKVRKAEFVLSNVSNDPTTANDLNKRREAYSDLYKQMNIHNFDRFLPEPPSPSPDLNPIEENALFLRDQTTPVLPQQNHEEHMQVHLEFSESSFAEQLTPIGKRMMDAHNQEHISFAYLAEEERQDQAAKDITQEALARQGGGPRA